jgi:hypothetical protein
MKLIIFLSSLLLSTAAFSQTNELSEREIPINIKIKKAKVHADNGYVIIISEYRYLIWIDKNREDIIYLTGENKYVGHGKDFILTTNGTDIYVYQAPLVCKEKDLYHWSKSEARLVVKPPSGPTLIGIVYVSEGYQFAKIDKENNTFYLSYNGELVDYREYVGYEPIH